MTTKKIILSLFAANMLLGCTTASQYLQPKYTIDGDFDVRIKDPKRIEIASTPYTFYRYCTLQKSAHSPVIFLPIIGPFIDAFSIPNSKYLTLKDEVVMMIPLAGPGYVYGKEENQLCLYHSYGIDQSTIDDKPTSSKLIDLAINLSQENCSSFENLIKGTNSEIAINENMIHNLAGAGATAAGLGGAGTVAGGLAMAGTVLAGVQETVKNELLTQTVEQMFDTVKATRIHLIQTLISEDPKIKAKYWEYDATQKKMPYGKFVNFMRTFDESCSIIQGMRTLSNAQDNANKLIQDKSTTMTTTTDTNAAATAAGATAGALAGAKAGGNASTGAAAGAKAGMAAGTGTTEDAVAGAAAGAAAAAATAKGVSPPDAAAAATATPAVTTSGPNVFQSGVELSNGVPR